MVDYVESWSVGTRCLGIEDHEASGDHFFPHRYQEGKAKRFHVWIGGCGCGEADTLEGAREIARRIAQREVKCLQKEAAYALERAVEWDRVAASLK